MASTTSRSAADGTRTWSTAAKTTPNLAARSRRHSAVRAHWQVLVVVSSGHGRNSRSTRNRRAHHHQRSCIVTTVAMPRAAASARRSAPRVCSAWAWTTSGRQRSIERGRAQRRVRVEPVPVVVLPDQPAGADPVHRHPVDRLARGLAVGEALADRPGQHRDVVACGPDVLGDAAQLQRGPAREVGRVVGGHVEDAHRLGGPRVPGAGSR